MTTKFSGMQGAKLYIMNPLVSPHVAVVVPQLQGVDGIGGKKTSIPVTNFDSDAYMEYAPGLVDPGQWTGNIVYDPTSDTMELLNTLLQSGDSGVTQFFFGFSDGTAPPTVVSSVLVPPKTLTSPYLWTRSGALQGGFVNEFTLSGQTNNVAMAKFSMQASGQRDLVRKGGAVT